MNLRHIALASAVVAAAPAFAATGSLNALYGVTAARTVYMSGASALSGSLAAAVGSLCTGGSTNIKSLSIGGSTSDGRVIVCTTSGAGAAAGFTGPFAVVKRDTNGSFDGVGPVIAGTALTKWANVNNCDSTALTCVLDSTTAIVPHGGLSDVETDLWRGLNLTGALSQAVPTPSGITLEKGFAAQGFGVMVSEELYKAMQTVQKADGRIASTCTVGDFTTGACQPTISKAEYGTIVRGDNFAYASSVSLTGTSNPINICRRVETSGTQATSNAHFLANACANANPTKGFVAPKAVDLVNSSTAVAWSSSAGNAVTGNYDDFGGFVGLFEGSGTGDAKNCVKRRNSGNNPNNVADAALGKFAIGWVSLENAPEAGWKYVKLDNVSPNFLPNGSADANRRANVARGQYEAMFEFEMLYPTSSSFAGFFGALKGAFSDPTVLNTAGIVVAPGAFTNAANPDHVAKGTRGGNSCAPQSMVE
jgi:hypothetical protein